MSTMPSKVVPRALLRRGCLVAGLLALVLRRLEGAIVAQYGADTVERNSPGVVVVRVRVIRQCRHTR